MFMVFVLSAIALIALLMLAVLQSSMLLSTLSLLLALGGIALWILRKKLPKWLVLTGGIVCILAAAVLLVPAGNGADDFYGYTSRLEDAEEAIHNGKYEQAKLLIEEVEEGYGVDDQTVYLSVIRMIAQKDYEGAYNKIEQMSDHHAQLYYTMKEQIYRSDTVSDNMDALCAMYVAAAQDHPDWTYMHKKAGIARMQQKNYSSAIYFLETALMQDMEDAETYYFLGVSNYYMSDYSTAQSCFANAIDYGLDSGYDSDLLWYLKQMNIGTQEG